MGYGREAYVWSMFAAFGLFTAGAVVSVMHGVQQLFAPEPAGNFGVAYLVLATSFVLEGSSFVQAFRQARKSARELERRTLEQVLKSTDPTMRAVFAEDSAALIGLVIAFMGIFLHQVTGSPLPDALGSILVGVLLGVIAVVLIDRNPRFLVGQGVTPELEKSIAMRLLDHAEIGRLTYLHPRHPRRTLTDLWRSQPLINCGVVVPSATRRHPRSGSGNRSEKDDGRERRERDDEA